MIQEQGYKDRIEQECVKLGVALADRPRVVDDIFDVISFLRDVQSGSLALDSPFFNFAQKIQAASSLLGIVPDLYLDAALKQPSLFSRSSETINANIEGAAALLDIDKAPYVQAALKQPSLFYQSSETINTNIEGAVALLGIDKVPYVQAALKQSQLFYQSPETINANIEGAATLLGVDKARYVQAALKQPQLFYQSPETIGRHGFIIEGLYSDGCLRSTLEEVIVGFPVVLCLADDNLNMRRIYAEKQGLKNASIGAVLKVSKSKVEDCLIRVHGIHPDDLQRMLQKLKADQKPAYQAYIDRKGLVIS